MSSATTLLSYIIVLNSAGSSLFHFDWEWPFAVLPRRVSRPLLFFRGPCDTIFLRLIIFCATYVETCQNIYLAR